MCKHILKTNPTQYSAWHEKQTSKPHIRNGILMCDRLLMVLSNGTEGKRTSQIEREACFDCKRKIQCHYVWGSHYCAPSRAWIRRNSITELLMRCQKFINNISVDRRWLTEQTCLPNDPSQRRRKQRRIARLKLDRSFSIEQLILIVFDWANSLRSHTHWAQWNSINKTP